MRIWPGTPARLGAIWDGEGVNFALFSRNATAVDLCLYDGTDPTRETHRISVKERTHGIWHCYSPDIRPGQLYGYRVDGPHAPLHGLRFNPNKVLIDPYARAIAGEIEWHDAVFGYEVGHPDADLSFSSANSAPYVPKCVVVDEAFTWGDDRRPDTSWRDTLIYEAHVKGMTERHPDVPEDVRGTYSGLAHPAMIKHFKQLGVTAVELMPVHQFVHDSGLVERGLSNYWGYNTIGFFAPHNGYAAFGGRGGQVQEFKTMVKALHQAGIEVIIDVVYNHTAEGNHLGPTLSFRGIDNPAYYRLVDEDKRYYYDTTGTGNSLNVRHHESLRLIMDSLRYWVTDMHVDGFRFDLVNQDPIVSQVKLIAEPWDVGDGGYQVGGFPPLWTEWNGKYRDTVRDFWRGEQGTLGELASRFTGSSDLYEIDGRRPIASINFVTAHDGFTLNDLVSYNDKHNEANGEDNRDGESHNRSWNGGVEGPTDDLEVTVLRERQKRNFLATLLLSQGVPMIAHGDEVGRTQHGNNNVYGQDSELSWIDWADARHHDVQTQFTASLTRLRAEHPIFRRRRFFTGEPVGDHKVPDIAWLRVDGTPMTDGDWNAQSATTMTVFLNGEGIPERDPLGEPIVDDSFLVLFNPLGDQVGFTLPDRNYGKTWETIVDTADPLLANRRRTIKAGGQLDVGAHTMVVLRRRY